MSKSPELLLPAGSLEVLKAAVVFGADAVYIGGEAYSLRAKAKNFTMTEMAEGIRFAHGQGVKVYVTANILAHDVDIRGAGQYFEELKAICPDALIISDPGMFLTAREHCPEIPIHISTQANNLNYRTFRFWRELGASRVVTGRELSLTEIGEIRGQIPDDLEIETFVHGAMCVSYSGRCLLSNYLAGRDANRGNCAHPCRWNYAVMEETRPGEYMPLYENERGTFLFSSKDLCMVEHLPDLITAGVDSLKVEGRMKSALYVASVGRAYRKALDDLKKDPELYQQNLSWYRREIGSCTHREFTTGFFYGKAGEDAQDYKSSTYNKEYSYLGLVGETEADGCFHLEQRNKFAVG
ncbi:MAG: U32 family peptidase [Lachnospiraceae bacterium]|nr:U32 family peptidase [Lachnospiraceae bacterium]